MTTSKDITPAQLRLLTTMLELESSGLNYSLYDLAYRLSYPAASSIQAVMNILRRNNYVENINGYGTHRSLRVNKTNLGEYLKTQLLHLDYMQTLINDANQHDNK